MAEAASRPRTAVARRPKRALAFGRQSPPWLCLWAEPEQVERRHGWIERVGQAFPGHRDEPEHVLLSRARPSLQGPAGRAQAVARVEIESRARN